MESFWRDVFIVIVADRFIFKNNRITISPVSRSFLQHVWGYLKQELVFTVTQNKYETI